MAGDMTVNRHYDRICGDFDCGLYISNVSVLLRRSTYTMSGVTVSCKCRLFARHVIVYHKLFRCVKQFVCFGALGRSIGLLFTRSILRSNIIFYPFIPQIAVVASALNRIVAGQLDNFLACTVILDKGTLELEHIPLSLTEFLFGMPNIVRRP